VLVVVMVLVGVGEGVGWQSTSDVQTTDPPKTWLLHNGANPNIEIVPGLAQMLIPAGVNVTDWGVPEQSIQSNVQKVVPVTK
jgi:hypothetical protein